MLVNEIDQKGLLKNAVIITDVLSRVKPDTEPSGMKIKIKVE